MCHLDLVKQRGVENDEDLLRVIRMELPLSGWHFGYIPEDRPDMLQCYSEKAAKGAVELNRIEGCDHHPVVE